MSSSPCLRHGWTVRGTVHLLMTAERPLLPSRLREGQGVGRVRSDKDYGDTKEYGDTLGHDTYSPPPRRHCEPSEAIQKTSAQGLDCFVALLLAMTVMAPALSARK